MWSWELLAGAGEIERGVEQKCSTWTCTDTVGRYLGWFLGSIPARAQVRTRLMICL